MSQPAPTSPLSELLIADFEDDPVATGWRVTDGDVQLEPSGARASRGGRALRITYGTSGFRIPRLDLERVGASDWTGWDTFEFDIYNAHPEPVVLRVGLFGGGVSTLHSHNVTVPPGEWHRYRMSARQFDGHGPGAVDRTRIDGFTVMGHPNGLRTPDPVTIYLDNIRLTNRSGERIASLRGLLDGLGDAAPVDLVRETPFTTRAPVVDAGPTRSGAREPDAVGTPPDVVVRSAAGELRRLALATTAVRGPEADSLSLRVSELERSLAGAVQARLVEHLALTPRITAPVPPPREPGIPAELFPLRASTGTGAQGRYDDTVEVLADSERILDELLNAARLDAEIERAYPGAVFAVGVPTVPTAWRDRPYSGEVAREVHLSAARHEFESFQLVILPRGIRLDDVRLEVSSLVGTSGEANGGGARPEVAAENVVLAPMGWRHELDGPAIADMIRTDIESFSVEAGGHQPIWGTVYVPEDTPPGEYQGTIKVHATGLDPVELTLHLTVWSFTLPRFSTLETATWDPQALAASRSGRHDEHARMVIQHRWNANYLYLWDEAPLPLETMQRLTAQGSTLHNLIRVSRNFLRFEEGSDGLLRATADRRDRFFRRLDPIIEQVRQEDPAFLRHLMLYGFDEPQAAELPAMNRLYGEFKERYGHEITTAFATMHDYWETHPDLENVDVWAVLLSRLTPEVVEDLHARGHRVWWYNIFARQDDPVRTRVQFWGTFKDGIDGVLHYNLRQAGDGTNPALPWGTTLWPAETRTDGGVKRVTLDDRPISTVAFDYWREGMEDVEYLALLRDAADMLRTRVEAAGMDGPAHHEVRALLREADALVRVPEYVSRGVIGGGSREVGEVIVDLGGHTEDMRVIMETRARIATLIVRIQNELAERP